jgi:TolB protein
LFSAGVKPSDHRLVAWAISISGVAILVALAAAAHATGEGRGRGIVYASNWTPHFRTSEIYAVGARDGRPRDLTNNAVDDLDPAVSPDGRQIAFARAGRRGLDVYLMNANGNEVRRLTRLADSERQPAWSPDGNKIAFAAPGSVRNEKGWRPEQVFVVNRDGSGLQELTNEEEGVSEPAWSPDGRKLAAVSGGAIVTMNADGSQLEALSFALDDEYDLDPDWSPDGDRIAFTHTRQDLNTSDVWVMNADGSQRRRLAKFGAQPAWSPDGRTLAFVNGPLWTCDRDGCYDEGLAAVATIGASGGRKHFVTRPLERAGVDFLGAPNEWALGEGASFFNVAWTPNGRELVYARRLEQRAPDLFTVPTRGGRPVRLTATAGAEINPVPSPDGRRVAFTRYRGHAFPGLYTMRVGGGGLHRVSVNASAPDWSPDGRRLAFVRRRLHASRVESTVFTAAANGSGRRKLASGMSPTWSPDGRRIAYIRVSGSGSSERDAVTVANADGTSAHELLVAARRYLRNLTWSPAGDVLAFTNSSRGQLGNRYSSWIELAEAGGRWTRRVTRAPFDDYGPVWSPTGRMLGFTRRIRSPYSDHSTVCVAQANRNRVRCLGRLRWRDREPSWAPAPDGFRLVFASLRDGDYEIYSIRTDGHDVRKLTNNLADDAQPSW